MTTLDLERFDKKNRRLNWLNWKRVVKIKPSDLNYISSLAVERGVLHIFSTYP